MSDELRQDEVTDPAKVAEAMEQLGPVPADCDGRVFLDSKGRPYYRRTNT